MAIVAEGTFMRAANRLNVTQPALSYQIKQLEKELGTSLLIRGPGRVRPTESGRVLSEHAGEILEAVRRARCAVQDLSEEVKGEVRIGTVNSVGIHFLPDVLTSVRAVHENIRPMVFYNQSEEIIDSLLGGHLDIAIVANPKKERRLEQQLLFEEPVSLVSGVSDPLFGKEKVDPDDLSGRPFVALSEDNPTGRLIRHHLDRVGVSVDPVVSTSNVETVRKMVEVGLGVGYLPDMCLCDGLAGSEQHRGKLSRGYVGTTIKRRIVLMTWKQSEMSRAVSAFVGDLRSHAASWRGCHALGHNEVDSGVEEDVSAPVCAIPLG